MINTAVRRKHHGSYVDDDSDLSQQLAGLIRAEPSSATGSRMPEVVSVKVVEIAGGLEVAIDQAAWGGTSDGGLGVASPSINGGSSSAMASTCM